MPTSTESHPFLTDVQTLRARARSHLELGAVTEDGVADRGTTIEVLQAVLATEIVCTLRYLQHSITGAGIASQAVKEEFAEHAHDEHEHAMKVAERINQLGGDPDFDPKGLASRSATQFAAGKDLIDMIRENLIAERIVVEHYRELIRHFGDRDPTTRIMLEEILAVEEDHADDMRDLLEAHEGTPMLTGH